jgi:hypothetical protein
MHIDKIKIVAGFAQNQTLMTSRTVGLDAQSDLQHHEISNSAVPTKVSLFLQSFSFPLLRFFITFFFASTLVLHYERLALYTTILNDERMASWPYHD